MFDDFTGYQSQWHFHVLVLTKRCFEIHILDVSTAELGIECAENAVPHDFRLNHIGCPCRELTWVID
jgi:hypothetical protein